jgi:hypothetical protein
MEILIIGLFAFSDYNEFAPSALNTVIDNNIEKSNNKMQAINKPQAQFEITIHQRLIFDFYL